jgi:surface antigen
MNIFAAIVLGREALVVLPTRSISKSTRSGNLFLTPGGDDFMLKLQAVRPFFSCLHPLASHPSAFLRRHRIASMIVGQVIVMAVLGIFVLNSVFGINLFSAFAQISCSSGYTPYTIKSGDTLGKIATAHGTSWQTLAQNNQISNPNLIYANHQICVPGSGITNVNPPPVNGVPQHNTANPFPYGQCTWWTAQRYQQLHQYFVPWTTNSNAWQWTARAYDFGWHVSSMPSVGAIIDFQPGVQYASSLGHVGVVEQILSNGDLITSNMNVVNHPFGSVVNLTFRAGPGVTFITA